MFISTVNLPSLMEKPILVFVLVSMILISGCTTKINHEGSGFLEGKIAIGPLCPVEMNPPQPGCQPTEETYKNWQIAIWTSDRNIKVAQINPELDGSYKVELLVGSYIADFEKEQTFGANNLPTTITITNGETTNLDINIDTGIR